MSKISNRCLEVKKIDPSGAFGGYVTLDFYYEKCLINLHPFFQDFFADRDHDLQAPDTQIRFREFSWGIRYYFSIVEFAESFFATFTSEQMIIFFEEHLIKNDNANKFLQIIREFEKNFSIAIMCSFRGHYNARGKICLYPINFTKKEIDELITLYISKKNLPKWGRISYSPWYHGKRDSPNLNEYKKFSRAIFSTSDKPVDEESIHKLRMALLAHGGRRVILSCMNRYAYKLVGSFNYFSLIKAYDLPTDHLKVVRKK